MPGSVRSDSPNDDVEVFACFRTLNLPSSLGWGGRKRPPHHSFVVEVPGSVGSPSATLLPIPDGTPPTMTRTQGITPGSSSLWGVSGLGNSLVDWRLWRPLVPGHSHGIPRDFTRAGLPHESAYAGGS